MAKRGFFDSLWGAGGSNRSARTAKKWHGWLVDYRTGEMIRPATKSDAKHGDGRRAFIVEGRVCRIDRGE